MSQLSRKEHLVEKAAVAPATPVAAVRAARHGVRMAMERCGSAQIETAVELLHAAAAEMRRAEQAVSQGGVAGGELRAELTLLKRQVAGLGQVVDAGGALYRGLAVRLGCSNESYAPQGSLSLQAAPVPAYEVKG